MERLYPFKERSFVKHSPFLLVGSACRWPGAAGQSSVRPTRCRDAGNRLGIPLPPWGCLHSAFLHQKHLSEPGHLRGPLGCGPGLGVTDTESGEVGSFQNPGRSGHQVGAGPQQPPCSAPSARIQKALLRTAPPTTPKRSSSRAPASLCGPVLGTSPRSKAFLGPRRWDSITQAQGSCWVLPDRGPARRSSQGLLTCHHCVLPR